MKILVVPDSFKGSNSSDRVADAIERGIRRADPDVEIVKIPIADGGEGTVQAVVLGGGGSYRQVKVTGPLGDPVTATYGILGEDRGVIEMAAASGLPLVPGDSRNPLKTTTRGTGELIRDALAQGCTEILVGIGGSATNDGGVGAAQALGFSFRDSAGAEVGAGGGQLAAIESIDASGADERLASCTIAVACDVKNPLCGPEGASAVTRPKTTKLP